MLHVIKKEQMSWKLGSVNGVKVVLFLIGDSKNLLLFAEHYRASNVFLFLPVFSKDKRMRSFKQSLKFT